MLRRRRLPEDLMAAQASFESVLAEVEPTKAALTQVMPTTRLPGRPLPDALLEFEERLEAARVTMNGWRRPETEEVWTRCAEALDESCLRARRMREEAPELGGFEGLIWAVERVCAPLESFEEAAERFSALRTRR